MTDRADEIAREWDGDEKLARIIRAYGDERADRETESMHKALKEERAARLNYNPRLIREIRNAALEEVLVITDGMEGTEWDAAGDWLGRKVRALKEKP